jgi:hypothetical protein
VEAGGRSRREDEEKERMADEDRTIKRKQLV